MPRRPSASRSWPPAGRLGSRPRRTTPGPPGRRQQSCAAKAGRRDPRHPHRLARHLRVAVGHRRAAPAGLAGFLGEQGGRMKRPPRDEEREQRITMEIVVDAYTPEEQAMGWYYSLEDR